MDKYDEYLNKIEKSSINNILNYFKFIYLSQINYIFFKKNKNNISIKKKDFFTTTIIKLQKKNIQTAKPKSEFQNIILHFFKVINKNLKKSNLVLFYKNFKNLKIKEFKDVIKVDDSVILGEYNVFRNKIFLTKDFNPTTLYHELLHMASAKIKNDDVFVGFHYYNRKKRIDVGHGINEGYTRLLTDRYFGDSQTDSYTTEKYIVENLEKIIGKHKLQKYYFNASLYNIINDLKQFQTSHSIAVFINSVDYIKLNLDIKKEAYKEILLYIDEFLIN